MTMSKWISVLDTLPEPLLEVLVYDIRGRILMGYRAETFVGKPIWYVAPTYGDTIISHWQPIPDPPEEEV